MVTDPYIGQEIIGQFRIVQRIGKGGMGAVYKAEQPAMERFVAVKILHRKLNDRHDLVTRFRREARAMSRLTHPNTVRVFLYGQLDNGALYIVMEHLEGQNLHQVTTRQGPLELSRAAFVLGQACGALEEAHQAGIIHRDLKPENILLTQQGGMPDFAKVLDFGLAKVHDSDMHATNPLTQEGMVFGTPEFMSPEQARGKTLDGRSDLYSLGTIFYELITGKLPFEARNSSDFLRHHVKSPPIPVSQRVAGLDFPPELDRFFSRALAKERSERFPSAMEMGQALQAFTGGRKEPVPLVAPTTSRRDDTQPATPTSRRQSSSLLPRPASVRGSRLAEPPRKQSKSLLVAAIAVLSILVLLLGGVLATLVYMMVNH
jgi:serine/threonine-protein kinase